MRNSLNSARDTWAAYVKSAREAAGLSQTELARRMGINRNTIGRWESGKFRPENADLVYNFANSLGILVDDALAAAGFRPNADPPSEPAYEEPPMDPQVAELNRKLQDPETSDVERQALRALLDYVTARARWEAEEGPAKPKRRRRVA